MPLTADDILRIEALGYRREEFSVFDGSIVRLRNVNGKCFFLDENNRCRIYEHRPEGCRIYPAIYDGRNVVVDRVCPKWREVRLGRGVERRLLRLIKIIYSPAKGKK